AEKYARACIKLSQQQGDAFMKATGSIALADALLQQGEYNEILPLLEVILEYGHTHTDPYKVLLYHLNNVTYLMKYKKDYASAVKEYEKALALTESIGDEWELMRQNSALSEAYLQNNQFDEAYSSAQRSMLLSEKLGAKDKKEIALFVLAQVNVHKRKFEQAYQQLYSAYLLKDTLFNDDSQQHTAFIETVYQTEKKELKIEALEKQRQLYIWLGIAGGTILLTVLAFALIRYRLAVNKRKL